MILVVLIAVALGGILLWALYSEPVAAVPRGRPVPVWDDLPPAADIRRRDFPLVLVGYDRDAVDAHLRAVAAAVTRVAESPARQPGPAPRSAAAQALWDPDGRTGPGPTPPLVSALDD